MPFIFLYKRLELTHPCTQHHVLNELSNSLGQYCLSLFFFFQFSISFYQRLIFLYLFFQTQLGSYKIFFLTESYLLALCKNDMQKEILRLFEVADITKISSPKYLTTIFKSLGRLVLENYMEKFILAFKLAGTRCFSS